ncbi:hypothetical protein L207DRAFT_526701 [Hyaloscypha variabilis F]|uniref:Uncharacterized protein n=1 Tax=Hyaloscypha variabilis (strain UAMH 11265 / GT02V1 / F) TaxID=1149755 RepID=A0A2J6RYF4_HYAVF|nr:hypothetical protein L207DRAFT_526701 [Hyaloscypha variabilis F]
MAITRKLFGILALALLSQIGTALPDKRAPQITAAPSHSCFTYTSTVPYTGKVYCPNMPVCNPINTGTCLGPAAVTTQLIDIPCIDANCPVTSTVTVTGREICHCASDCGTKTVTNFATYNCPFITAPAPVETDSFQIG